MLEQALLTVYVCADLQYVICPFTNVNTQQSEPCYAAQLHSRFGMQCVYHAKFIYGKAFNSDSHRIPH